MKLFLAAFLLLASLTNISIAAGPTGKESLIITSTPQPCQQAGCVKDEKGVRVQNIKKQYTWINQYKPDAGNLVGVVVPGNLTESGTTNENVESDEQLSILNVPYFFGLGANDYIDNNKTCTKCAIEEVMWLGKHIEKLKGKGGFYKDVGKVYFDFMQGEAGTTAGWAYGYGIGGLGYTIELGAQKNIYLIQINGHVNVGSNKLELDNKLGIRDYLFKINPVTEWLANRLEYAAQYPFVNRGAPAKTIVVSMNGSSVDPEIIKLLNRYAVKFRFLSNNGSSPDCRISGDIGDDSKFFCLGFSTEREVLELELDYDRRDFTVFNQKIAPDVRTKLHGGQFYDPIPELKTGEFYPQNKVVMFRHSGWYNYVAKVSYVDSGNVERVLADSGKRNANTIFMVDVPAEISKVTVSHAYMPGNVEVLKDTARKDLGAAAICVATNGYENRGSRESQNKVEQSTIETPINSCAYP